MARMSGQRRGLLPHFWYVHFASEMKVFCLVGGVRVYMVMFKAHKYMVPERASP